MEVKVTTEKIVHICGYDSSFRQAWNNFLDHAKNASFLFHRDYMEYHADRFNDCSIVACNENKKIMALFPANLTTDNTVVSHQGLTYGGMVVDKEEKLRDMIAFFSEILKYYHQKGIDKLIYKEIPAIYNNIPSDEMQYIFFILGARLFRRDAGAVIKIAERFSYQRRRLSAMKNARKIGVEIRQDNDFDIFWNGVLEPNLQLRHGVRPVHSVEEIKLLHSRFPDKIKQFNAYYHGEIMAGVTIFEMDKIARAQYTSGTSEGRKNGSLDLLFDTLISEVYPCKDFFDFGNSNENDGLVLNLGLLDWKEGLGARTYSQNFYEMNTADYVRLEHLISQ
jgi:hypothetical protein